MSLRYRLATPALWARRLMQSAGHGQTGFRAVLFHATENRDRFEQTVSHISNHHGFVDPKNPYVEAKNTRQRAPVLLSFDDGFQSNHTTAATVLEEHGTRGMFFVCPGLHDLTSNAQRDAVAANVFRGRVNASDVPSLMTWDEIGDLAERGHVIGAHGMTHTRLSTLSGGALAQEIEQAGATIKDRIGVQPAWYAWAFGDIDSTSAEAMAVIQSAYPNCRSGIRGRNGPSVNHHAIRAEMIDCDSPIAYQALALEGGFDRRYAKARSRLDQITRNF